MKKCTILYISQRLTFVLIIVYYIPSAAPIILTYINGKIRELCNQIFEIVLKKQTFQYNKSSKPKLTKNSCLCIVDVQILKNNF